MDLIDYIKIKYFMRDARLFIGKRSSVVVNGIKVRDDYEADYPDLATDKSLGDYNLALDSVLTAAVVKLKDLRDNLAKDEDEYIQGILEAEGVIPDKRWKSFQKPLCSGKIKVVSLSEIEVMLKGRLEEYNRGVGASGFPTFKREGVIARFDYMRNNKSFESLGIQQKEIKFDESKVTIMEKWIDDLIKVMYIQTEPDIARVVLKHMMWQVKRRFFGESVRNDLWTAFQGGQGKGKTFVMRNCIFKIFSEFYCETQLSKIDDLDREVRKFSDNFIVNFEELALGSTGLDQNSSQKINGKSVGNLKSLLTADELYIRRMGGQDQSRVAKTFVPISTANERLSDVIHDSTGMRRFFELEIVTPEGLSTFDTKEVKRLGDLSIDAWKGIDEENDKPVWVWDSEIGQKISEIQSKYRPITNVDDWLREEIYQVSESEISTSVLYADYKKYCTQCGYYAYGKSKFQDTLKGLHKPIKRGTRGTYFAINKLVVTDEDAPNVAQIAKARPSFQTIKSSKELM